MAKNGNEKSDLKIETQTAKPGFVFLAAPEGTHAAGWNGEEYVVDKDGCVEVPLAAVAALADHGFVQL
jgi:glutathione peroxidase-family protein